MDSLVVTQDFNTPIEKVWKAFTDPDEMKGWYFYIEDFDFKEGSEFAVYESDKKQVRHDCKIEKIVPLQQFVHTCSNPDPNPGVSTVTWNLESLGPNKTRLTLVHNEIENMAGGGDAFSYESFQKGWNYIINTGLVKYLDA